MNLFARGLTITQIEKQINTLKVIKNNDEIQHHYHFSLCWVDFVTPLKLYRSINKKKTLL